MAEKVKINILQTLIDGGLDEDAAKKAQTIINRDVLPKNYIPSDQYNDKVLELADTKRDLKTAQDDLVVAKGFESKYNDEVSSHGDTKKTMQKTYDDYVACIEADKTTATKREAIRKQLAADGANQKLIGLLEKEFDLAVVELDGDAIKGWDALSKSVKETYADVFGTTQVKGTDVANPPAGGEKPNQDLFIAGFDGK